MALNEGYPYITVVSILTFITCTATCITILHYPRLRNDIQMKYTFYLALIYGVSALVTIIPAMLNEELCTFQAFIIRLTGLAGVLWTGYIAFYLYWETVLNRLPDRLWFYTPLIIIFLFSLLTAILSLDVPKNYYGPGTNWCWNSGSDNGPINQGYKFGLYYAIAWAVIVWQIYVIIHIRYVRVRMGATKNQVTLLKYYSIILIVCYIPQSILRILQSAIGNGNVPIGFQIFSGFVFRSLGFFNCVVYGLNSEVKEILFKRRRPESASSEIPANGDIRIS